jgi:hypothetical protein
MAPSRQERRNAERSAAKRAPVQVGAAGAGAATAPANLNVNPAGAYSLVHYSAQLEPFLTQKHTLNTPNTPYHPLSTPKHLRNNP